MDTVGSSARVGSSRLKRLRHEGGSSSAKESGGNRLLHQRLAKQLVLPKGEFLTH